MALLAVPNLPTLKVWVERVNPDSWIVLDYWDSVGRRYRYHDLDHPERCGAISADLLEACFRSAGATVGGEEAVGPTDAPFYR